MCACAVNRQMGRLLEGKDRSAGFQESHEARLFLLEYLLVRAFTSILDTPSKVILGDLGCPCPNQSWHIG